MGYLITSTLFAAAGVPLGLAVRWAYMKIKGAGNVERARTTP